MISPRITQFSNPVNDLKILDDLHRISNKLPLINKNKGLLWVFQRMMFQSKGLMNDRLAFLYDFFLKGDHSKSNPNYFYRY